MKRYWYRKTKFPRKKCYLTKKEIRKILKQIATLRINKRFRESDRLRDRLIRIGTSYIGPDECREINHGNLLGHIQSKLRFQIKRDLIGREEISVYGQVCFDGKQNETIWERVFIV